MKPKLELERIIASMSICAVLVVALSLALVAHAEYCGLPYVWQWEKIVFGVVLLLGAAIGMTVFAVRATNLLVPEVCQCNSTSSIDGVCNDCGFRTPESN